MALRDDVRSIGTAFELGKDAQQEYVGYVGRVLLQTLVRFDNKRGDDCRKETSLPTDMISAFGCGAEASLTKIKRF